MPTFEELCAKVASAEAEARAAQARSNAAIQAHGAADRAVHEAYNQLREFEMAVIAKAAR